MQSPTFTVSDDYLNFLVGGGKHPRVSDKLDNTPPEGELKFNGFEVPEGTTLADAGWTGTGDLTPELPARHQRRGLLHRGQADQHLRDRHRTGR